MNGQYDVIRERAWDGQLLLEYGDEGWVAQVAVRPPGAHDRWVSGEDVTLELAVAALERSLGLPKWSG